MLTKDDITEAQFRAYQRVQQSGECNMITDALRAMMAADLDEDVYWEIVDNYEYLQNKFKENNNG